VLGREHHERREARRLVLRCARAAVLAEREADLHACRPDRVERGVEEVAAAGMQRRHQHPAEPLLLRPVDVGDGLVDVVEADRGETAEPSGRLRAEVDEPPVVRRVRLAHENGVGGVVDAWRVERLTVREHDLRDDTLRLQIGDPARRIPLARGVETRVDEPVGRPVDAAQPLVQLLAAVGVQILAVRLPRRLHVPVDRDDRSLVRHRDLRRHPTSPARARFARNQVPMCSNASVAAGKPKFTNPCG